MLCVCYTFVFCVVLSGMNFAIQITCYLETTHTVLIVPIDIMATNRNMNCEHISINSFNCRGIRDFKKRATIFHWLSNKHGGISLLQETHSMVEDESVWKREYGGIIYYSHGTNQSRGVAILIPDHITHRFKHLSVEKDIEGRLLILNCEIDNNPLLLINVYAPTKDLGSQQMLFFRQFEELFRAA